MIQMPLRTLMLDQRPTGNLTRGVGPTQGPISIRDGEKMLPSHLHQGGIRKIGWHQDVVSLLPSLIVIIFLCALTNEL